MSARNVFSKKRLKEMSLGESLRHDGVICECIADGDYRWSFNISIAGQRLHRVVGKTSMGTSWEKVQDVIVVLKQEALHKDFGLPNTRYINMTFSAYADLYLVQLDKTGGKNIEKKRRQLKRHLRPYLGQRKIKNIRAIDLESYQRQRLEQGAMTGTINRETAVVSHMFHEGVRWEWLKYVPARVRSLTEELTRTEYLEPNQIDDLLVAAHNDQNEHIETFVRVSIMTAMRKSEVLAILVSDIKFDSQTIFVSKAKAGAREQPMTLKLSEFLRQHLDQRDDESVWLFPSVRSETGHAVNIDKAFRRVVRLAGLDPAKIVRHTLRHTAITQMVQTNTDLPTVKRFSGHKTSIMVERYAHQSDDHIRRALAKLDDRYDLEEPSAHYTETTQSEGRAVQKLM